MNKSPKNEENDYPDPPFEKVLEEPRNDFTRYLYRRKKSLRITCTKRNQRIYKRKSRFTMGRKKKKIKDPINSVSITFSFFGSRNLHEIFCQFRLPSHPPPLSQ